LLGIAMYAEVTRDLLLLLWLSGTLKYWAPPDELNEYLENFT
jgi:hypothetical protein